MFQTSRHNSIMMSTYDGTKVFDAFTDWNAKCNSLELFSVHSQPAYQVTYQDVHLSARKNLYLDLNVL